MPTLFALAVLMKNYVDTETQEGMEVLLYIAAGVFITTVPLSSFVMRNMISSKKGRNVPLEEKLAAWQTGMIVKASLLELPAIMACIAALLTGTSTILLLVPVILLIFFINRPTAFRLENDLDLSREEADQLRQVR